MQFLFRLVLIAFGLLVVLFSSIAFVLHRIYPVGPSEWILFESDREGHGTNLYQMRVDGSHLKLLTQHPGLATLPTWSPDNKRIAFQLRYKSSFQIYIVDADTGAEKFVADMSSMPARSMSWSPRGDWIAFTVYQNGGYRLYRMRPDGSGIALVTNAPLVGEHAFFWSPDGQWIALFARGDHLKSELFRVHIDGSGLTHLADLTTGSASLSLGWSEDSKWLTYTSYDNRQAVLYRINASGGTPQPMLKTPVPLKGLYRPAWSPDGQWIAFVSYREYIYDVHIMRTDGSDLRRVTSLAVGNAFEDLSWSPDSQWLIFRAYQDGNSHSSILRMRPDGSSLQQLTRAYAYDDNPVTSPPVQVKLHYLEGLLLGAGCITMGGIGHKFDKIRHDHA